MKRLAGSLARLGGGIALATTTVLFLLALFSTQPAFGWATSHYALVEVKRPARSQIEYRDRPVDVPVEHIIIKRAEAPVDRAVVTPTVPVETMRYVEEDSDTSPPITALPPETDPAFGGVMGIVAAIMITGFVLVAMFFVFGEIVGSRRSVNRPQNSNNLPLPVLSYRIDPPFPQGYWRQQPAPVAAISIDYEAIERKTAIKKKARMEAREARLKDAREAAQTIRARMNRSKS